jgi:tetratricopeptide (TPR) repeat protein
VVKTFKKVLTQKQTEKFVEKITAPEFIAPVSPVSYVLETPISAVEDETALLPKYNSDVIYIYDLKVTDYNGLYFARLQNDKNPFHTHVPVFKENREDENELIEETHILPADRVLKDGLEAFNKQHYRNALEHFNLLLENNPEDINAQFYAALSYYNENKFERSQSLLEKLLGNKNNTFFQEAQWYSALNDLKLGNKEKAKQQLEQISNEKGFYAKKAKIKLRNL